MSLIDTIKARIKTAMLSKNDAERNILRVLLGESQTLESRQGSIITDEQVVKIAKKLIASNNESVVHLEGDRKAALLKENEIISSLLPKEFTAQESGKLLWHAAQVQVFFWLSSC